MSLSANPLFRTVNAAMTGLRSVMGGFLLALWAIGFTSIFDPYVQDGRLSFYYLVATLVMIPAFVAMPVLAVKAFSKTPEAGAPVRGWRALSVLMLVWGLLSFPLWALYVTVSGEGALFNRVGSTAFFASFIYIALGGALWPSDRRSLKVAGRAFCASVMVYALFWLGASAWRAWTVESAAAQVAPETTATLMVAETGASPDAFQSLDGRSAFLLYQHSRAYFSKGGRPPGSPALMLAVDGAARYRWSERDGAFIPTDPFPDAEAEAGNDATP